MSLVLAAVMLVTISIFFITDSQERGKASRVVSDYFRFASNNQWDNVQELLTGEALAETIKNIGLLNTAEPEIVVEEKLKAGVNGKLAVVDADVVKTGLYDNRVNYRFHLIKTDASWKIYKVTSPEYTRPDLRYINAEHEAEKVVEEYYALDYGQRTENAENYLAGKALAAVIKSRGLPYGGNDITERLVSTRTIGVANEVVTIEIMMEVAQGEETYHVTSLIDLVKVRQNWRIINVDNIAITAAS